MVAHLATADPASELVALREQHERLTLQAEVFQLGRIVEALEQSARHVGSDPGGSLLRESHGDIVDRREFLYDSPGWVSRGSVYSIIDDRADGKNRPIYETEYDVAVIRAVGQLLCSAFPAGVNIQESLTNYTIGTGFTYKAKAADGPSVAGGQETPAGLIEAVQKCVDTFLDDNDFVGDLEREIHERSREDGETFLHLRPHLGWRTKVATIEAAQITEPANKRELESWLRCDERFVSSWSFGIHTRADDTATPLGYHVVRDGAGNDWDYLPAREVEHIKRNVRRNMKRGVSDYYPVQRILNLAQKVLENTGEGASIQASIAWIVEHAAGTTQQQVGTMAAAAATRRYTEQTPNGGKTRYEQIMKGGRVLHVSNGQTYHAGPMGAATASPNFIITEQALLRYAGVRWSMPEYMISGDASNSNFASTLVAEAPFVKSREADQAFYKSRFARIVWKVLRNAHDAGYFDRFGVEWPMLEQLVDIEITAPEVASRDKGTDLQVKQAEFAAGVITKDEWRAETGRPPLANEGECEHCGAGGSGDSSSSGGSSGGGTNGDGPSGELAQMGRLAWKNNRKAINDLLADVAAGQITAERATVEMGALGIGATTAAKLIDDATQRGDTTVEDSEVVAESTEPLTRQERFTVAARLLYADDLGHEYP